MPFTKINDEPNRRQYTASAGQTVFPFPFVIFEDTDLDVYKQDIGTTNPVLLTVNNDYTVTGIDVTGGGNVTLLVAASAGDIITIQSDIPLTQLVDFATGGEFLADTINTVNDKNVRLIQQVNNLIATRGLTYPTTEDIDQSASTLDNTIPILAPNSPGNINVWTKSAGGAIISGTLEEGAGFSTLRSELALETNGSDGALLVGYYDQIAAAGKTVSAMLDALNTTVSSLVVDSFSTGDTKPTYKVTADTGWIMADDGSIGSAASGATTRANADTEALYTLWWDNITDQYTPVSTGRGASAAADFAANKTLRMPQTVGRTLSVSGQAVVNESFTADAGTDIITITASASSPTFVEQIAVGTTIRVSSSGTLPAPLVSATDYYVLSIVGSTFKLATTTVLAIAGTPIDITTAGTGTHTVSIQYPVRTLGQIVGEAEHVSTLLEIPAHEHPLTIEDNGDGAGGIRGGTDGPTDAPFNVEKAGGSQAHSLMQPTTFENKMIKL